MDDILKKLTKQSNAEKLIKALDEKQKYLDSGAFNQTPAQLYPGRNEITEALGMGSDGYYLYGADGIEQSKKAPEYKLQEVDKEIRNLQNSPEVYEKLRQLLKNK